MYKFIMIIICLSFSFNVVFAKTVLNGGVSYTVAEAREIAFENIDMKIPMELFKNKLVDTSCFKIFRNITVFSDGGYAIKDKKNKIVYYYSSESKLVLIEVYITDFKTARYDIDGNLDTISIDLENKEQFVFTPDKKLLSHWKGKNCYNEKGELIKTRD